jgi:hypothetical protein
VQPGAQTERRGEAGPVRHTTRLAERLFPLTLLQLTGSRHPPKCRHAGNRPRKTEKSRNGFRDLPLIAAASGIF